MKTPLPFITLLVGLALGYLVGRSFESTPNTLPSPPEPRGEAGSYALTIQQLQSENESLRAKLSSSSVAPALSTPTTLPATSAPEKTDLFRNEQIKEVDHLLQLSTAERSQLTEAMESGAPLEKALKGALSPERQQEYETQREKQEQEEVTEQIDTEVFRYSRKLELLPAQEQALRSSLLDIAREQKPLTRGIQLLSQRASELHTSGDSSSLRDVYQEMRGLIAEAEGEKRQKLRDALAGTLTDAQLNALVDLQEKEKNRFFEE